MKGVYYVGLYAGYSLALGAGTFLDDFFGWKWAYLLAALGGVAIAIVAFSTVPEPEPLVPLRQRLDSAAGTDFFSVSATLSAAAASAAALIATTSTMEAPYSPIGDGDGNTVREYRVREDGSGSRSSSNSYEESAVVSRSTASSPFRFPSTSSSHPHGGTPLHTVAAGEDHGVIAENRTPSSSPSFLIASRPFDGLAPGVESHLWRRRSLLSSSSCPGEGSQPGAVESGLQPRLSLPPLPSLLDRVRAKIPDLSAAWLGSPSLLLVCLAGGVRDAGGFVFGYYLASYFSPLMDGDLALTGHGGHPCSYSFDPSYIGEQVLLTNCFVLCFLYSNPGLFGVF